MQDALSLSGARQLPLPTWLTRYVEVARRELLDGTVNDAMWVN